MSHCPTCDGYKEIPDGCGSYLPCPTCSPKPKTPKAPVVKKAPKPKTPKHNCPTCDGYGEIPDGCGSYLPCPTCMA